MKNTIPNKIIKIVIASVLIFLAYATGYLSNKTTSETIIIKEENQKIQNDQTTTIPECYAGHCPRYYSWDVDGDELSESVVIQATAMTQGAGMVYVINDGKIVFKSPELPGISVEQADEDSYGFYINYNKDIYTKEKGSMYVSYTENQYQVVEK